VQVNYGMQRCFRGRNGDLRVRKEDATVGGRRCKQKMWP
jgi:hypothetical protein